MLKLTDLPTITHHQHDEWLAWADPFAESRPERGRAALYSIECQGSVVRLSAELTNPDSLVVVGHHTGKYVVLTDGDRFAMVERSYGFMGDVFYRLVDPNKHARKCRMPTMAELRPHLEDLAERCQKS
jgi:hypothetical protein